MEPGGIKHFTDSRRFPILSLEPGPKNGQARQRRKS
jgi:hypothetical protein